MTRTIRQAAACVERQGEVDEMGKWEMRGGGVNKSVALTRSSILIQQTSWIEKECLFSRSSAYIRRGTSWAVIRLILILRQTPWVSLQVFYLSVSVDIQRVKVHHRERERETPAEVPPREALTLSNQMRLCLIQLEIHHNQALFVPFFCPIGESRVRGVWHVAALRRVRVSSALLCLHRMDDIQLCKEITRLKTELHKLVSVPGSAEFCASALSFCHHCTLCRVYVRDIWWAFRRTVPCGVVHGCLLLSIKKKKLRDLLFVYSLHFCQYRRLDIKLDRVSSNVHFVWFGFISSLSSKTAIMLGGVAANCMFFFCFFFASIYWVYSIMGLKFQFSGL